MNASSEVDDAVICDGGGGRKRKAKIEVDKVAGNDHVQTAWYSSSRDPLWNFLVTPVTVQLSSDS